MWEAVALGDICEVLTKGTTPTSIGFQFECSGINFIKVESIAQDGNFIPSRFAKVSEECHNTLGRSRLKEGDILFSIAGALGRTAIVTKEILPANTNQALAILRLKSYLQIDKRFLYYVLSSNSTKEQSNSNKGGVAQQNLSLSQLKNYTIHLPPLAEQQRIVAKLDAAFAEIDKAIQIADSKEAEIKNLSTTLLSVMLNANEHVNVKLGEVAKAVGGNGFPTKFQGAMSKEIPFFKVSDMNTDGNDVYMVASNNYVDLCDLKQMKAKAHPKGTIIFPKIGGAISTNKKRILASTAAFDNNVMGVIPSDKILSEYLYKIFLSIDLYELSNKAALPSITNTTVENIEIPLPPKRIQESIVARLDNAHDAVEVVSNAVLKSKENLAALKSAILAQALQPI